MSLRWCAGICWYGNRRVGLGDMDRLVKCGMTTEVHVAYILVVHAGKTQTERTNV